MYIDAHNHLDFYGKELNKAINIINKNKIQTLACSMNEKSYLLAKDLSKNNPFIIPCFGIHPWNAHEYSNCLERFDKYLENTPIVGEIGLDFHWVLEEDKYPHQIKVLEYFFEKANKYNKITNLHTKGAEYEILKLIKQYNLKTPIIHWYSGPLDIFKKLLDYGCYFTIGVDIGYSKITEKIVKILPLEKILTETDGPTALEWINGQCSYPDYIINIVEEISILKGIPKEEIKEQIYNNFNLLFK
ncbi:MAG: TatD family hydrolase [Clostridiaceae bacterium]|nr:TatD family hydrolase [Clostridiaceae bacterium]MBW4859444.1 TatD family hydrolase [Clostridiaceae bacterium]MBW4867289.1 TatD family hydrolase [Clostridiaceae bacterium]